MLIAFSMLRVDLSKAAAVSSMIQLSVRCAVPWLYLAFAASSLQVVFPGSISIWLLRNRKMMGLCFAAAMGWQLAFILWLVGIHTDYYVSDVYVFSDVVEGLVGYAFLIAMVLALIFEAVLCLPERVVETSGTAGFAPVGGRA